jgi:HAD superfamily hydrolase (TIGR01509 family)
MIKTVIFDMDGVLIDSIPVHFLAWQKLFSPHGTLTWEEFVPLIGISTEDTAKLFLTKYQVTGNHFVYAKEKDRVYLELTEEMQLYSKIPELLQYLQGNGLNLVVATSEPTDIAVKILTNLKIAHYFEHIIGRDQVKHIKPAPDIFLKAAEVMHSKPDQCVVIEDSVSGILAAKKAGMKVIGITTTTKQELLHEADIVTDNLYQTLINGELGI